MATKSGVWCVEQGKLEGKIWTQNSTKSTIVIGADSMLNLR